MKRYLAHPAFAVGDRRHLAAPLRPRAPGSGRQRRSTARRRHHAASAIGPVRDDLELRSVHVRRRTARCASRRTPRSTAALTVTVLTSLRAAVMLRAAASAVGTIALPGRPRPRSCRSPTSRACRSTATPRSRGRSTATTSARSSSSTSATRPTPHRRRALSTSRATSGTSVTDAVDARRHGGAAAASASFTVHTFTRMPSLVRPLGHLGRGRPGAASARRGAAPRDRARGGDEGLEGVAGEREEAPSGPRRQRRAPGRRWGGRTTTPAPCPAAAPGPRARATSASTGPRVAGS